MGDGLLAHHCKYKIPFNFYALILFRLVLHVYVLNEYTVIDSVKVIALLLLINWDMGFSTFLTQINEVEPKRFFCILY